MVYEVFITLNLFFTTDKLFHSNNIKVMFIFVFQKRFWKKNLFFSLLQINIFLVFLDHFDALISKIIF
jgi:hypothetical protein